MDFDQIKERTRPLVRRVSPVSDIISCVQVLNPMLVFLENIIGLPNFRCKMFGLFKRTKIEDWEIELLRSVISSLEGDFYASLRSQIDDGLFRGVLTNVSDIPGYVAFTFHSQVLERYDRENERDFRLTNIRVYDQKSSSFISYEIYVSSGTISGYSLEGGKKPKVDISNVDTSNLRKEYISSSDYERLSNLLTEEEKSLINPSDVYSIIIKSKEYFHVKDLHDGDFIGIDKEKKVFKITHDPMEVTQFNKDLEDIL